MIQVGIVGLGGIGNNHVRCYTDNKYTKVVAVCDLIKDRQKRNRSHNSRDNGPQETAYDNAPLQGAHQSRSIL